MDEQEVENSLNELLKGCGKKNVIGEVCGKVHIIEGRYRYPVHLCCKCMKNARDLNEMKTIIKFTEHFNQHGKT